MSSYLHVEVSVNFFFFLFFFLLRRTFKKICSLVDFIFCRGVTSLRHKAPISHLYFGYDGYFANQAGDTFSFYCKTRGKQYCFLNYSSEMKESLTNNARRILS